MQLGEVVHEVRIKKLSFSMSNHLKNRWYASEGNASSRVEDELVGSNIRKCELVFKQTESLSKSFSLNSKYRSVLFLIDSLRDLGCSEIDSIDLSSCSERVVSVLWKLVSERQRDSRQFSDLKDRFARTENDNKLLKATINRLTDEIEKSKSDKVELDLKYKRSLEEFSEKLVSLERNRMYVFCIL